MKVIKKGRLPIKEKRCVCSKCGCEFIYNKQDIRWDHREHDYYVICPTCTKFISVNENEL